MPEIVDRAGGRGKMKDVIDPAEVEGPANVLFAKFEARFAAQVGDVLEAPGEQVVGANHRVAPGQQSVTQVRAQKSGAARHQHAHFTPSPKPRARAAASAGPR